MTEKLNYDVTRNVSKKICDYLYEERTAKYIIYMRKNREYINIACYLAFSENIEVF